MSGTSNGSRSHPRSHYIRFTIEEDAKISKLLRKRALTMQAFAHAAILRAFNEASLGRITESEIVNERIEEAVQRRTEDARAPKGLGIRERLLASSDVADDDSDEYEVTTPAPQPQPTPQSSLSSHADVQVMALARTIVEAPQSVRGDIWRAACHTLTLGRSKEEALQLADELDAAIKRLGDAPKTALDRARARAK